MAPRPEEIANVHRVPPSCLRSADDLEGRL
jgi:hypothetical protein